MAWSDYKICDCCGNAKVFYDANIQDARYQATWGEPSDYDPIGLKAICGECNKTHEVVVALREKGAADHIEELVKEKREAALSELAALGQAAEAYDAQMAAEAKLAKAEAYLQKISRHANRSCAAIATHALAELEGKE